MRIRTLSPFVAALSLCLVAPLFAQRGAPGGPERTTQPPAPRFYYMGPATGGRIASVVGVPGDPNVYYVGNASGGLYKSTDGAKTFVPIFDKQDVAAIGTLAIDPSNTNTIWVGTGEPWVIRASDVEGDGVYKSTDAGATWQNMGLADSGRIARIVVNPTNSNIVFVCSEGHLSGVGEKGIYRSDDAGANWKRVLYVDPTTSCSGLALDPNHPDTMIAGMWTVQEHTYAETSGGSGSGVYLSHDGGLTWTKATNGMPHAPIGKVEVAIAPSDGKRMYAQMQTADQGSLWRSDDGGDTWAVVSWDRSLIGRAGYYFRMAVNPFNEDEVLISSSGFHRSLDGGHLFTGNGGAREAGPAQASCGDCHDIWMDPKIKGRYALTEDGGSSISTGTGAVLNVSLPNGQMYHVASDNRVPYWLYSNRQDNGTWRGPSTISESIGNARMPADTFMPYAAGFGGRGRGGRGGPAPAEQTSTASSLVGGPPYATAAVGGRGFGPSLPQWQSGIGGCESGFTVPDPTDANIVWASCYGNKLTRYDAREGESHSVEPWMISLDSPPNEAKYRCHWTSPVAIDPFNHNAVYYGCQMVLKTTDQGNSWTEFSPDLSTKDPSRIVSNGGIEGDNLGQFDGEVVWAIAPSPIQAGLVWAGTNDGKLWYTKDGEVKTGSAKWVDVSANLKLPPWGAMAQISPSNFDPGTAYVAVDYHLMDNRKPYVMKTTDFGVTWKNITSNLPTGNALDYVVAVAENPNRKGMLFAGTGHGFFYSMDDGGSWTRFDTGLPPAPVTWINIEKRFHDVDISTYGRGLYILPDISVLEQTGKLEPDNADHLYKPGPVFRMARDVYPTAAEPARPQFQFTLAENPSGPVKMEILDSTGKVIRTQELSAHAGLNGAYWDLHLDGPKLVELRTTPPENPHIWDELRYKGKDVRTITHWGITPTTGIPVAAPGNYSVRMTLNGTAYTQPFKVLKDPAVISSDADLQASTAMQVRVRDDITATSEMVNKMEVWRKQLQDESKSDANAKLDAAILNVEHQLITEADMLSDDKHFPVAYHVYMNLIWTSGAVGQGASDEAGGLDYRPTQTQREVVSNIEASLAKAKADFATLQNTTIPAYNQSATEKLPLGNNLQ
ncbi:MAG TPA: hypothetical protein VN709_07695 [Terriglobales bacterium]|nr:hypothetical protein [Terriglobales bacterium]